MKQLPSDLTATGSLNTLKDSLAQYSRHAAAETQISVILLWRFAHDQDETRLMPSYHIE